jgi:hypothetical protein
MSCPRIAVHRASHRVAAFAFLSALMFSLQLAQAQTETVLYNFPYSVRAYYDGPVLTPDGAGNFYGVDEGSNGAFGSGAVFELSPNGSGDWSYTTVYSFCSQPSCVDGATPIDSVIFDSLGNLYGTTFGGGAYPRSSSRPRICYCASRKSRKT